MNQIVPHQNDEFQVVLKSIIVLRAANHFHNPIIFKPALIQIIVFQQQEYLDLIEVQRKGQAKKRTEKYRFGAVILGHCQKVYLQRDSYLEQEFFYYFYLQKIKMETHVQSKKQLQPVQKSSLNFSIKKSRFSMCQSSFHNRIQEKRQLLSLNKSEPKNQFMQNGPKEPSLRGNSLSKPLIRKLSCSAINQNKSHQSFTPLNLQKIEKLQRKISNQQIKQQINYKDRFESRSHDLKKLHLDIALKCHKPRLRISSLLGIQKIKQLKIKKTQQSQINQKNNSSQNNYNSPIIIKSKHFIQFQSEQQKDQLQTNNQQRSANVVTKNISSYKNTKGLRLNSGVLQIVIDSKKTIEKQSIAIQTMLDEKQYFQYLVYKRKKQSLEFELQSLFSQLQIIKRDRLAFFTRTTQTQFKSDSQFLKNQLKTAIDLRQQMHTYQQKLTSSIELNQKCQNKHLEKIQNIEKVLIGGVGKLGNTFKGYWKIFANTFQKYSQVKLVRICERLSNITQFFMREILTKINAQIEKTANSRRQTFQLSQIISEYDKSIRQYKTLLRISVQQLKELPELCFKLYGDDLKDQNSLEKLRDKGQIPKCLQCCNSEWKIRAIIQKNSMISSIMKATEELVR